MTLAAREIGMTIIPEGKCTFPLRVIKNYKPTGIVGSVFNNSSDLQGRWEMKISSPQESSIQRLVVSEGGFADDLVRTFPNNGDVTFYNTYGSTEGQCAVNAPTQVVSMFLKTSCTWIFMIRCLRISLTMVNVGELYLLHFCPWVEKRNILLNYDTMIQLLGCNKGSMRMRKDAYENPESAAWIRDLLDSRNAV